MKKNLSSRLMSVLAVATFATVLTSCGTKTYGKGEAPELTASEIKNLKTTVTWWNNYQVPDDPTDEKNKSSSTYKEYYFLQNVITEFNKLYPNITIDSQYKGSYSDIQTAVNSAISGGGVPTMASCYADHVAGYMKAGASEPMGNYFATNYGFGKSVNDAGEVVDDEKTAESDLNANYLTAEKKQYSDGLFYSMPYSKSSETLVVNQDVFNKVGAGAAGENTYSDSTKTNDDGTKTTTTSASYVAPVAVDSKVAYSVPTNWKELIATARQMKVDFPTVFKNQKDADGYFTAIPFCWDSGENMMISMFEMMDIPYTSNASSNVAEQILFNNDQAKELVVQLKKWNNEGLICTQSQLPITNAAKGYHQYSSNMVASGSIFMCISSTAGARYFANTNNSKNTEFVPEDRQGKGGFAASLNATPAISTACFDDATGDATQAKHKVISQGPSLTFFTKADKKENVGAFLFYKFLTNTDNSASLASTTNYFPIRTSSENTDTIQKILNSASTELTLDSSYSQKTATYGGQAMKLNDTYSKNGSYFTSPAFDLSASCRTAIGNLINTVFNDKTATTDAEIKALVDNAFTTAYSAVVSNA